MPILRVWSHDKFIRDGSKSSMCFDSVAIHGEFSMDLEYPGVLLLATPC
jgi:hypothetical protein